jgi:serine/threonine protein kinase
MKIPREFYRPVRIGSGTFSTVYRAYQPELERYVALKFYPNTKGNAHTSVEQEMRILSSLQLPCVPHIYNIKRSRNRTVLVMEWIRGIPLSLLLRLELTSESKIAISTSVVENLARLHENQIFHGDLKPENILVTSDLNAFFVDFGFSLSKSSGMHSQKVIQGTPKFMAPELWSYSDSINRKKVDLYALGIVLRELLGDALPDIANDLIVSDPGQRPSDAVVFKNNWSEKVKAKSFADVNSGVVTAAIQEYIARMLLTGARELYVKGKNEDAYALLTESLEIWPDQHEALEFLQQKFSSPVKKYGIKQMTVAVAATITIGLSITIAYFAGKNDSASGIIGNVKVSNYDTQIVSLVLLSGSNHSTTMPAVALRETGGGMNLIGTVSISRPLEENGTLIIDGTPVTEYSNSNISIQLKAGSHRVEWIDSASRKRFSEIVELLPFENKKISLRRFN